MTTRCALTFHQKWLSKFQSFASTKAWTQKHPTTDFKSTPNISVFFRMSSN